MAESNLHAAYLGHAPTHHSHGSPKASEWSLLDEPSAAAQVSVPDSSSSKLATQPSTTPELTKAAVKPLTTSDVASSSNKLDQEKIKFLEGKLSGIQQSASAWKEKCLKVRAVFNSAEGHGRPASHMVLVYTCCSYFTGRKRS
jgi:hypothetical protein